MAFSSARYPGQRQRRRYYVVAFAVLVALASGIALGRVLGNQGSASAEARQPSSTCAPGHTVGVAAARNAACLLQQHLSLNNQTQTTLAAVPVNAPGTPPRYATPVSEYASVVAVRIGITAGSDMDVPPEVRYSAWVVFVDTFADRTSPIATWYVGHFAVRWQHRRWRLTEPFIADRSASPTTYTTGTQRDSLGPGWVPA